MKNKDRLISLDYALQQLNMGELEYGGIFETDSYHIKEFLSVLPTVDAVEVVHGRWEHSESMVLSAKCSKCKGWVTKHSINEPDFNYCPNCGAKMRE